jgi:ribosomal protein S18 acetylase RimI-like enzyme
LVNKTLHSVIIRNYKLEDADSIGHLHPVLKLTYLFNKDLRNENIFCAEWEGNIIGVGHLEPDGSWDSFQEESNLPFKKLRFNITLDQHYQDHSEVKYDLFNALLKRAKEIQVENSINTIKLINYIDANTHKEAQFLIENGFCMQEHQFFMMRNLSEPIPEIPQIAGINIRNWKMATEEEILQYLEAESSVFGHCWSSNRLKWYRGGPEWNTFTAFAGENVAASIMTWGINGERSATENVFVKPEWRGKGVSKAIILRALHHLKTIGKKQATLTVRGDNLPAIKLYTSLGYKVEGHVLEMSLQL